MSDKLTREWEGDRVALRVDGPFDRAEAWALRERIERETAAEIVIDLSLTREISDLAVAVLAHGLQNVRAKVLFRGLRQHQVRILKYCGVPVLEAPQRASRAAATAPPDEGRARRDSPHAPSRP